MVGWLLAKEQVGVRFSVSAPKTEAKDGSMAVFCVGDKGVYTGDKGHRTEK